MELKDISFVERALSPMGGLFTFIFLFTGLVGFIAYTFRKEIREVLVRKRRQRDYSDLRYHSVFNIAANFPKKVRNIDFTTNSQYDPVKTRLIHKLLMFKSTAVNQYLGVFLERTDLKDMHPNRLRYEFSGLLMRMIQDYNKQAISHFVSEYGIDRVDATYLVDKYEENRQYLVDGFTESVEVIAMDDNYEDNFMKINSIFYLIGLSLDVVPNDVRRLFDTINGRFKKYTKNKKEILPFSDGGIDWDEE